MAPKEERSGLAGVNGGTVALHGDNVAIAGHGEVMHGAYRLREDAAVPIHDKTEGDGGRRELPTRRANSNEARRRSGKEWQAVR
jgi:hypothetical protein